VVGGPTKGEQTKPRQRVAEETKKNTKGRGGTTKKGREKRKRGWEIQEFRRGGPKGEKFKAKKGVVKGLQKGRNEAKRRG